MQGIVICHHGVKGQKWGRRRYQNTDGSYKSGHEGRYDDDSQSSESSHKSAIQKHKESLIQKYKDKGYGDSAAAVAAKQRMTTETILAAAGTVAVTAIAVSAARKIGQEYIDKTIKAGQSIQNIGADPNANFKDRPFFAAINKHDKKAYGNMYGYEKRGMMQQEELLGGRKYEGIFNNKIKITEDAKRASVHNARKIFYDKMDKDQDFKKEVIDTIKKTNYGQYVDENIRAYKTSGKRSRQLYDRFNQALATPEFQKAGLHNKFYDELKKNGYDAILDINDARYSGYAKVAKAPTIFFGKDKWEKISSTRISEDDITNNAIAYGKKHITNNMIKDFGTKVAVSAAVTGLLSSVNTNLQVNNYLRKHPNTKKSRKEIIKKINDDYKEKMKKEPNK